MGGASVQDWVFFATGWTLLIGAAVLGVWALFWDRSRGRKRCPGCWYDMAAIPTTEAAIPAGEAAIPAAGGAGVPVFRCPECGKETRAERGLALTRRRWGWAGLAVLLALGADVSFAGPRMQRRGWIGLVPSAALIGWVARFEPPDRFDRQTQAMVPPTRWAAELAARARARELSGWEWHRLLRGIKVVRSRERWPAGVAYKIATGLPGWLGGASLELKTEAPFAGQEKHYDNFLVPWSPGEVTRGVRQWSLSVRVIDCVARSASKAVADLWSGSIAIPVESVGSVDEAMAPVRGEAVDAAVQAALDVGIREERSDATGTDAMVGARLYRGRAPALDAVAVGLRVELRRDGQTMSAWSLTLVESPFGEPIDWNRFSRPRPDWGARDSDEIRHWSLHVVGAGEPALVDFARSRYWAGEFSIPLVKALRPPGEGSGQR